MFDDFKNDASRWLARGVAIVVFGIAVLIAIVVIAWGCRTDRIDLSPELNQNAQDVKDE